MRKKILKLLYRSLDSPLGKKDRGRLDRTLEADPELARLKDDLLAMRRDVANSGARAFRPGFAGRTMARLRAVGILGGAETGFLQVFLGLTERLVIVGAIVVVAVVAYVFANGELIPRDAVYYVSDLSLARILQFPVF
jgi:hypothetical protein